MASTKMDSRQSIIRSFLEQLASKADYDGTADNKPASTTEVDNLLTSLNTETKPPLRLDASTPNDRVITVGPAIVTNSATDRSRSIPHVGTLLPTFTSGTYTFPSSSGGTIVASPGNNNTLTVPSGQYVKVLLYLDTLGQLNSLVGDPNATESLALVLPAPDSSLPIGYVSIHNTGGTVDNIAQSKIFQFGTGAGGGGSGDSLSLDVLLRDRFAVTDFEFLEENIFKRDQSTKVNTGSSTGSFSFAKSAYFLSSIGQTMVSYNNLDSAFLAEGVDVTDIELYLQWLSGFADSAATYEASRDGGTNWSTITMSAVGAADYRGYLTFSDEVTQQSLQTYANTNSDTNSSLTGSGAIEARAQKFTVTNTEVLRSMDIYLNKVQTSGAVAGKYKVTIVRDSSGAPSTAAQDILSESDLQNATSLSTGLNTVTLTMPNVVLIPADYWIVFSTDADYKASYSAGVRSIDVRSDTSPFGTGSPPSAQQFNGTTWSVSAGPIALVYLLKGRVHDLRIRVTSGTVTKYIEGYGVYYGLQSGVTSASGVKRFNKFYFTGDSNTTDFTLTFTPDPELLEIIDPYRGQCYAIEEGVARIIGQIVRFEPNTFNFPGENVVLIFRQVNGSTIDNSNANAAAISTINTNLVDVGNQLVDTQRVSVPLLTVPNTGIVNRAQIPDPSQDLKPRLGIERVMVQSIFQLQNEFGATGEIVWGVLNDDRGLIRLVGTWGGIGQPFWGSGQGTGIVGDYVEITFYGTGLNLLTYTLAAAAPTVSVTVDGSLVSASIYGFGSTASSVLTNRGYAPNQVFPVVSGLALGTHTVKITATSVPGYFFNFYGLEIINDNLVTTTGNTHTSAVIDGIPSTSQLAIGMSVSGSGVPGGATISSVDSSSQVTISAATTSTLTGTSLVFSGSLKINPGSSYVAGKKITLASAITASYKSGFETGTLGTRGGRVLVYQKSDGTIGKAVTPTNTSAAANGSSATINGSALNGGNADHSNEEVIKTYYWREFGGGRFAAADDFSSLVGSASNRNYTLDDGTTHLLGLNVYADTTGSAQSSVQATGATNYITITFVGTGLDVLSATNGGARVTALSIDGVSVGNLSTAASVGAQTVKIVSGLPYGTHVVRFTQNTLDTIFTQGYRVYGPKKPTLPTGAIELADYNIMGNFVANTVASADTMSVGVLRKHVNHEMFFINGTGGTTDWTVNQNVQAASGNHAFTDRTNGYMEYTFFGTGFDTRFESASNRPTSINVSLQSLSTGGSLLLATTANFAFLTSSVYGTGVTFSAGVLDQQDAATTEGSGLVISGLPLGLWKVRFNNNGTSTMYFNTVDVITPIHSPKSNIYADLQNTLSVGSCGISDNRPTKTIKELTTLPSKAWVQALGINSTATTSVATLTPMPDMSATIKTSGGPILIMWNGSFFSSSTGTQVQTQIYVDGFPIFSTSKHSNIAAAANNNMMISDSVIVPVSAGTHKIDIYWANGGSNTVTVGGSERQLIVQEK